jgi:hypothetical protein
VAGSPKIKAPTALKLKCQAKKLQKFSKNIKGEFKKADKKLEGGAGWARSR